MKINYPNKSDLVKKTAPDAGGDIMIHGSCVTIGCIPLENDPVEEVYILATEAKNRKLNPKLAIYPCRFTEKNNLMLVKNYPKEKNVFWETLKKPCAYFNRTNIAPTVTVSKTGDYIFKEL